MHTDDSTATPGSAPVSLELLRADHADALYELLKDPRLYEFLDNGPPDSAADLRLWVPRDASRRSPDGREFWLTWVVRDAAGQVAGYVQATVPVAGPVSDDPAAAPAALGAADTNVAYVFAPSHWGRGLAAAATREMMRIAARDFGAASFKVSADRRNARSIALARRLGFVEATAEQFALRAVHPNDVLLLRSA